MKTKSHLPLHPSTFFLSSWAAALLCITSPAIACGDSTQLRLFRLASEAVSTDENVAARAISALRQSGQAGLDALFTVHDATVRKFQHPVDSGLRDRDASLPRVVRAIEAVSRQRDGITSRLYWFTELEKAKAAARASDKPILSLRLLGQLDEEYSCANSRFFRTALYANSELFCYLREHFVLHWESVRPVPRITIDFGDGRKLERTITGNSIHYVLDPEGRPLDALPGLYGPKAFRDALARCEEAAKQYAAKPVLERDAFLREHHRARLAALMADWSRDLTRVSFVMPVVNTVGDPLRPNLPPTAAQAARVARGKGMVEVPLIRNLAPRSALDPKSLESAMTDELWSKVAALRLDHAKLDAGSRRLMMRKLDALQPGHAATREADLEHTLLRAVEQFERAMSEDTVRNEFLLHSKIHQWFASGQAATRQVTALNDRVYAELFLTPGSDPWLGLKPADTYSALPRDGVGEATRK